MIDGVCIVAGVFEMRLILINVTSKIEVRFAWYINSDMTLILSFRYFLLDVVVVIVDGILNSMIGMRNHLILPSFDF